MRCFVAVDISEQARAEIGGLQQGLKHVLPGVRWVRPDRVHFTLVFLGEVAEDSVESARARLAREPAGVGQFDVKLHGVGAFPNPRRARVIWVGVDQGKEELCRLQRVVEDRLKTVGHEPERRPFSPHLTLGRLRMPADASGACTTEFRSKGFEVDRFVLYRSVLRPEGPEYSRLAEFPLA